MAKATPKKVTHPLCAQFGFTSPVRQARLKLMQLSDGDRPLLRRILHEAILPNSEAIMDAFYDHLLGFEAMRRFLNSAESIPRLKKTQHEYLSEFGSNFGSADYFEYRLRIGVAHERIGMPLNLYLAAYRHMQHLIIQALPPTLQETTELYARCVDAVCKIVMLDMSLAIDTYTAIRIDSMSDSIHALQHERDFLSNQLMHDTLTGTLSRRFVLESLGKHLSQLARQPEHSVYVALFDLDHFKHVNDTYGHLVGDMVLREFAHNALSIVREQDYFGRYGGEEFLLVITGLTDTHALEVVERIRTITQAHTFYIDKQPIQVTVSCGLTTARPNENLDEIVQRADSALYQSKQQGRNRVTAL